jgi:hypothetical protein
VSPTHVAQAADDTTTSRATDERAARDPSRDASTVYETWWFWTIVGAVVVGSAVGIGVAASGDEPLETGDVGGVVFTLGSGR